MGHTCCGGLRLLNHYDVVIVGAGICGLAAAHQLTQADPSLRLCVLEKGRAGREGATAVSGGFVRVFDPDLRSTELAAESFSTFWKYPQHHEFQHTGHLFRIPGSVLAQCHRQLRILERHNIPFRVLSAHQAKTLSTEVLGGSQDVFVFEPLAGVANPRATASYLLRQIRSHGRLTIQERTSVEKVVLGAGLTRVRHTTGELQCRVLVFALGGWSIQLKHLTGANFGAENRLVRVVHAKPPTDAGLCLNDYCSGAYSRPLPGAMRLYGAPQAQRNLSPDLERSFGIEAARDVLATADGLFSYRPSTLPVERTVQALDSSSAGRVANVSSHHRVRAWVAIQGLNGVGYKMFPSIGRDVCSLVLNELQAQKEECKK